MPSPREPRGLVETPFGCLVLLLVTVIVGAQLGLCALSRWPDKAQAGEQIR